MSILLPVPSGKIAAIVTHLEMTVLPPPDETSLQRQDLTLDPLRGIGAGAYKSLFRAVGADWLWFSRLRLADAEVAALVADPAIDMFGLRVSGTGEAWQGLLELDWRQPGTVEVAFLGVVAPLLGRGAGRFLLAHAIERARLAKVGRIWLHTCSFDHPRALSFYRRAGFRPCKQEIELTDDPRRDGTLPPTAAPHVPAL